MGGDSRQETKRVCLGIEGGGTKTTALFADAKGKVLQRLERGPFNLKLSTDQQILNLLRSLRRREFRVSNISLCLAGCRTPADCARVRALAGRVFPDARCVVVGSDLDSGFATAFGTNGAGILVISGTGSCVFGRNQRGQTARAGGRGHLLGDCGSGYWIAITGLRAALRDYDRRGVVGPALRKVLRRLALNSPDQLTDWIPNASKADIAALAPDVMEGDAGLMLQAASFLAMDCHAVAKKLRLGNPDIALAGGVFEHHEKFCHTVAHRIRKIFPHARIFHPKFESAHGALLLAWM